MMAYNEEEQATDKELIELVLEDLENKTPKPEIIGWLIDEGLEAGKATAMVNSLARSQRSKRYEAGQTFIKRGICLLSIGAIATCASYNAAPATGTYVILTGFLLIGGLHVVAGLWSMFRNQ